MQASKQAVEVEASDYMTLEGMRARLRAWVHGCMGAWVRGCVGARVRGCTGFMVARDETKTGMRTKIATPTTHAGRRPALMVEVGSFHGHSAILQAKVPLLLVFILVLTLMLIIIMNN